MDEQGRAVVVETQPVVTFGTLLRRYRIAAGLTQEELAERASISRRGLGDMERGVVHAPRKDTVTLLADALSLSPPERTSLVAAARRLAKPALSVRGSAVPSASPFVGRARELALLERHLGASVAGFIPPVLLLAGEPGIGKTRLLHAAIPRAVAQGWCVLEGGCQRRGGHEPYAPILGALQRYIQARTPVQLRRELAGCAWSVRLLPELAGGPIEPLPAWTLSPAQERRLMVAAVVRFLSNVAGPAGTLLLLDDLQWAGPDALELLTALVGAAEVPVRVICAYRDMEVRPGDPLGVTLADLAHAGLTVHHTLDPLTLAEAEHLVLRLLAEGVAAGLTRPEVVHEVVQRAGGVPFFLVSYARGLQSGGGGAIPWDLAQGLRQRVAALPAEAQEVLGVAAVIGRVVPRGLLVAALAQPDEMVLAALDAACAAQLVREEGADAHRFVHDVIREVVEADLGAARRALLHCRVAEALQGQPGEPPVERLAYHYCQGASWSQALTNLMQAGDKAVVAYANQDALDYYTQALEVCAKLGDAARPMVVAVAQKRGDIHMLIQHPHDARGDYDRMAAVAHDLGDRRAESLALAYRGRAEEEQHLFETAEATLRAALAMSAEGYDDARQLATWTLVHTITMIGRKAEAEALLRAAEAQARRRGDRSQQEAIQEMFALFYIWDGRLDAALALYARFDAAHPVDSPSELGWQWAKALALGAAGDYTRALALLHAIVAACDRSGEVWTWRRALNTLGWLYGELQDHQRALDWNTRGVQAVRERGAAETNPETENNARLNLGDTLLALGRLDDAEAQFRAVEQIARTPRSQDRYMLWRYAQHLFHSYGELWLARGAAAGALAYADDCLALAEPMISRKNMVKGRRLRGQALLGLGRLADAEHDLDTALQLAQQVGNPCQLWKTYAACGELRRVQGRTKGAHAAYHAACETIDRVAAALSDAPLRATFLTSAHVQHIRYREQTWATRPNALSHVPIAPAQSSVPARHGAMSAGSVGRRPARPERQAWALEHLRTAGPLCPRAYAMTLGVSVDTALRDLQGLVNRGLVQAKGTTKDRRYILMDEGSRPAIHRTAP